MKTEKIETLKMNPAMAPVETEVKNLLEMFEFYLTEREFEKSIETLGEAVRDMRLIIGRILIDHFLGLKHSDGTKFLHALALMLVDRAEKVPTRDNSDSEYCDYVIGEILTAFEYAEEIKKSFHGDPIRQKILSLDIPILRPFDYGMKNKLKIVKTKKKRRTY